MSNRNTVPDAWEDDWTSIADVRYAHCHHLRYKQTDNRQQSKPQPSASKLSKSEKRAQHQQLQKELWASAENPGRNLWLEAKGALPLKQEFVPSMTVLSRRPATNTLAKRDPSNAMAGLSVQDDEDSEEEARKRQTADLEERQRKAKIDREEKVRKYAEARERIMGTSASASTRNSADSRESSQGRNDSRRQRGGANRGVDTHQQTTSRHTPAIATSPAGQLFDPEDMTRRLPRRDNPSTPERSNTPRAGDPIRQPKGPDTSGRSGFGFAGSSAT